MLNIKALVLMGRKGAVLFKTPSPISALIYILLVGMLKLLGFDQ